MKNPAFSPGEKILFSFLMVVLFVLLCLFISVVGIDYPIWTKRYLGLTEKNEVLKFLGIGMGGVLVALQALMSYKRARALEETADAQAKATDAQAKANENTEKGQRQERLKNAIEHLGHDKDSVRLGGAYELFHLAEETKEWRQTILDILCAHIRWTTRERKYGEEYLWEPSEEIQSLLTLLFVQKHEVFTGLDINLRESRLNGSNLSQARLGKANLIGAWLHGAHFFEAQLHGADLFEAQLHGAHLLRTQLHGADLSEAQLLGASSRPGDLYEDEPFEAVINTRIGKESDLSGAIFEGGLTQEDVDSIGKGLPDKQGEKLRANLEEHIGKPLSNDLPENRGAIIGAYTKEKAAQWIAEYNSHVSRVRRR